MPAAAAPTTSSSHVSPTWTTDDGGHPALAQRDVEDLGVRLAESDVGRAHDEVDEVGEPDRRDDAMESRRASC